MHYDLISFRLAADLSFEVCCHCNRANVLNNMDSFMLWDSCKTLCLHVPWLALLLGLLLLLSHLHLQQQIAYFVLQYPHSLGLNFY